MEVIWFLIVSILWALFAEIAIAMTMHLGKIRVTANKRLSLTFYRWLLFSLGELNLALYIALTRWLAL